MKLSVVILCWNDLGVIGNCLRSIYAGTHSTEFEVIVSDNGSTDGSIEFIHDKYPQVRLIENGANLRFAKGNNVAIQASKGEYVLILNPDTIVHDGSLDRIVGFADRHPQAGAFGCKILNADGSYQVSARPFPSLFGQWIVAFYARPLARVSDWFISDMYTGWKGETERAVGYLSGCFILARGELLKKIGGFDEQFFYYYEDIDLCRRIWGEGYPIIYSTDAVITHLGGQSTKRRFPIGFALDSQVTRYRYYYKYGGRRGAQRCRRICLTSLALRQLGYRLVQLLKPTEARKCHLEELRTLFNWNLRVDPVRLVENGEEPEIHGNARARVLSR